MKKDKKSQVVKLRLSEYTYLQVKEVSEVLGLNQSTIMRKGVERFLAEIYDETGAIKSRYRERARAVATHSITLPRDTRDPDR